MTATLHDKGLSTTFYAGRDAAGNSLSGGQRRKFRRLQKHHSRARFDTKRARNMAYANSQIERICGQLEHGEDHAEAVCDLYRRAADEDVLMGRSVDTAVAALYYAECRRSGRPVTVDALAEFLDLDPAEVVSHYRGYIKDLSLGVPPFTPADHVPRLTDALDLPTVVESAAIRLAQKTTDAGLANGRKPSGFAAACIYLKSNLTQQQVADAADCSIATVRKHKDRIRDYLH
jgi:transcription initiation factor TFIIB